jgi:hypothetical protein
VGRKVAPLTVAAIRAAPVGQRLFDGDGLVIEMRENALGRYPYALLRYSTPNGRRREYGLSTVDVGTPASRGGASLAAVRDEAGTVKRDIRAKDTDPVERASGIGKPGLLLR